MLSLDLKCAVTIPRSKPRATPEEGKVIRANESSRHRVTGLEFHLLAGPAAPGGTIDFSVHLVYD